jgi:hypothetical protein
MLPVACPQALGTCIATVITAIHLDMKYLLLGFQRIDTDYTPVFGFDSTQNYGIFKRRVALQSAFQTLQ